MPPKRAPDPPEEVLIQLDLSTINDKLNQLAKEVHDGFQVRDEQFQVATHIQDDRFQQLMAMMEKMNKSIKGKGPDIPQSSHSGHHSTGLDRDDRRDPPSGFEYDEPHGNYRTERYSDQATAQRVFMPQIELPVFDGSRAGDWLEHCKFYFDYYQTPEMYKVQMATMNFVGDAAEWFSCYRVEHPDPPWPRVVDAIFELFFVWSFICGLQDEIQHSINLFKPNTLDEAFNLALEIEVAVSPIEKKASFLRPQQQYQPNFKPINSPNLRTNRYPEVGVKRVTDPSPPYKPNFNSKTIPPKQPSTLSIEQKRALGLCYRCGEKWGQGHKCARGLHTLEEEGEGELKGEEEQLEGEGDDREIEEEVIGEEQLVTLSSTSHGSSSKSLSYKGQIGNIPICVLIDTGASHSFISPVLVAELTVPTESTPQKTFRSAGGKRLVTDQICPKVQFQIQGHTLEADLRVLSVPGYDIVLGCDWVAERDDVVINLKKGVMELEGKWSNCILKR
ncbi:uncharacterized protein LOC144562946 [Carex rostrata]